MGSCLPEFFFGRFGSARSILDMLGNEIDMNQLQLTILSGTINSMKLQTSYGAHKAFDRGKCMAIVSFLSTIGTVSHGQVGKPPKPPQLWPPYVCTGCGSK